MHRSPARKLQYVGAMAVAGVEKGSRVKELDDRRDKFARMPSRNDHSALWLWREGKSAGLSPEGMYTTWAPSVLTPKRDRNAHAIERYDIDAAFCETGVWYNIHLKPDYFMYLPMHWWHQVSHTAPLDPIFAV
jgi:hypothetical protein